MFIATIVPTSGMAYRCTGGMTSTGRASPNTSTECTQATSGTSIIKRIMIMTILHPRYVMQLHWAVLNHLG